MLDGKQVCMFGSVPAGMGLCSVCVLEHLDVALRYICCPVFPVPSIHQDLVEGLVAAPTCTVHSENWKCCQNTSKVHA